MELIDWITKVLVPLTPFVRRNLRYIFIAAIVVIAVIVIAFNNSGYVECRVTDKTTDKPIYKAKIHITYDKDTSSQTVWTGSDGIAKVRKIDSPINVSASKEDYYDYNVQIINPSENARLTNIELSPFEEIKFRVINKYTNKPVSDAQINTRNKQSSSTQNKITNPDGYANFEKINFPIKISVLKNGYNDYETDISSNRERLEIVKLEPETIRGPGPEPKKGKWGSTRQKGVDGNNKSADYEFYTLIGVGNGYRWQYGSTADIEFDDGISRKKEDVKKFLKDKFSSLPIDDATGIIMVGNASCEGDSGTELERAKKRSQAMMNSIQVVNKSVQQLILGKYKDDSCPSKTRESTLPQRSIIVITMKNADPGLEEQTATKNAFEKALKDPKFQSMLKGHFANKSKGPLGKDLDIHKYEHFKLYHSP